METITRADLPFLIQADPATSQISMFMPTHGSVEQAPADQLRWKNLLTSLEDSLAGRMRTPEIEDLLAPARALRDDARAWQRMSEGVALFMRPGWHRSYRIPFTIPEFATVGDRLVLGPLFKLLSGDEQFLVLALSQQNLRLLDCTRRTVDELPLDDVPTALRDAVEAAEPRSDTMTRPASAGSGGAAVFYGHGASDDGFKRDEVTRFLREVSAGLTPALNERGTAMVLVGPEPLVAVYRGITPYPHVLDEAVIRNPDPLSAEELHQLAWPVIDARLRDERAELIAQFRALNGTGRVSSDPELIHEAALQGRVQTLFLQSDPWCWEREAAGPHATVLLGEDEAHAGCERVEATAVATMSSGGLLHATSETVDPARDSDMAAILRY